MPYQLVMVAAPVRLAIQILREEAESLGFRKVTPVIEGEGGLSGFCILHHADRAHQDDPLARFFKTWLGREEAIKGQSTSFQLVGGRLPSTSRLCREWSTWLQRLHQEEEKALRPGNKGRSHLDMTVIDQAMAEGLDKAFHPSKRDQRQQEFEQMMKQVGTRRKPDSAQEVTVISGRQETLEQGRKIFRIHPHFSNSLTAMESLIRDGLIRDGLPPIAWDALELANSPQEEAAVLELLKKINAAIIRGHEDPQKHNRLALLADADPALFLPFCRPQPVAQEQQAELFDNLLEALQRRFLGRRDLVKTVATNLVRRLAGDASVLTLLLHGPPGTGKSFLVTQLAEALTEAGVAANTVFQAMTEGGSWRGDEQLLFQITGTAAHFSNGDCGSIYRCARSRQHRLSLVLLDEAEKCGQKDFMVNLLDPRLPLEDCYVKGLVSSVDMRQKTVFFLSANDTAPLCLGQDDPLWSRLQPVYLRPYGRGELEQILVHKVMAESPFDQGARKARAVVKRIVDREGEACSLRKLLDEVNSELFLLSLNRTGLLKAVRGTSAVALKKTIGFRV